MLKPVQLLQVARFSRPGQAWRVTADGTVMDAHGNMFSLTNRADREAAQIQLFEKGWRINAITRHGQTQYKATRHCNSRRERARLDMLILACVECELTL